MWVTLSYNSFVESLKWVAVSILKYSGIEGKCQKSSHYKSCKNKSIQLKEKKEVITHYKDKYHFEAGFICMYVDINEFLTVDHYQKFWELPLQCVVVQLLSHVQFFSTPWTAACQAFLSFTISHAGKIISLLFSMLSRFVIALLSRSKRLLISCRQSPSAVVLEPKKIIVSRCFHCFHNYLPWSGPV